jgi:hypothetical protein
MTNTLLMKPYKVYLIKDEKIALVTTVDYVSVGKLRTDAISKHF